MVQSTNKCYIQSQCMHTCIQIVESAMSSKLKLSDYTTKTTTKKQKKT